MAAQALYRRWRPQTFDDVVGQTHIVQTLRNALASERFAHAYLFAGPRGTGKTTIARILARAVNCTASPERRPCGECRACISLAEGRSMDLIEIDAASHTGVDNVRDLIEKVQFAPTETRYKVYIIDEVHMLSTPAFNALLKTLEEPPPHALFFLATTEIHKIPATILSRCQRFNFHRIPLEAMVDQLDRIGRSEGFHVEPGVLELIARHAQGGLRDGISLLDQMVAYGGASISLAQVQAALGTAADAAVEALADHIVAADASTGLRLINQAVDAGVDPRQLVAQLLEYLRGLLLIQNGSSGLLNVTAETLAHMEAQARRIPSAHLLRAIKLFSEAAQAQRGAAQPQLPVELAMVEATLDMGRAASAAPPPVAPVSTPLTSAPAATREPRPVTATPAPPAEAPLAPLPAPTTAMTAPTVATVEATPETTLTPVEPTPVSQRLVVLKAEWEGIQAAVNKQNRQLGALLKDCYPLDAAADSVTLGVYYQFHLKRLEEAKTRGLLEGALSQALGGAVRVMCKLTPKTKAEQEAERPKNPIEQAVEDPLVREAVKMGGKITGISMDSE